MEQEKLPDDVRVVQAERLAMASDARELPPPTGVEVAFAGRSNVGKSSVINSLVGRRSLARTSSTPGCTRSIGLYQARFADRALITLADLPGYGWAKRSKSERESWADLTSAYLLGRATLRVVVCIVDARRGLGPGDVNLLVLVRSRPRVSRPPLSVIVVATKLDKLGRAEQRTIASRIRAQAAAAGSESDAVVGFSAVDGRGKQELWRRIRAAASLAAARDS